MPRSVVGAVGLSVSTGPVNSNATVANVQAVTSAPGDQLVVDVFVWVITRDPMFGLLILQPADAEFNLHVLDQSM